MQRACRLSLFDEKNVALQILTEKEFPVILAVFAGRFPMQRFPNMVIQLLFVCARRRHFASELARNLVVRFIAGGQELKDEASTLRSHRISVSGAVLHCLVTPARAASPPADEQQNAGYQFDIGILMFPLFGTLLIALWYARVVYRGYFNGTSTFSLLAISFLYIIALLASLRGSGQTEQHPHIE